MVGLASRVKLVPWRGGLAIYLSLPREPGALPSNSGRTYLASYAGNALIAGAGDLIDDFGGGWRRLVPKAGRSPGWSTAVIESGICHRDCIAARLAVYPVYGVRDDRNQ